MAEENLKLRFEIERLNDRVRRLEESVTLSTVSFTHSNVRSAGEL